MQHQCPLASNRSYVCGKLGIACGGRLTTVATVNWPQGWSGVNPGEQGTPANCQCLEGTIANCSRPSDHPCYPWGWGIPDDLPVDIWVNEYSQCESTASINSVDQPEQPTMLWACAVLSQKLSKHGHCFVTLSSCRYICDDRRDSLQLVWMTPPLYCMYADGRSDHYRIPTHQEIGRQQWLKAGTPEKPKQFFWYWCISPEQPEFMNTFIERPAIDTRLMYWLASLHDVTGMLYCEAHPCSLSPPFLCASSDTMS